MKKKILLSILCICMVLTMMPTVGYAVEKPEGDLYVDGVLIYSSDTAKTTNPDGVVGVKFDIPSSTLTLTNAKITNGVCGSKPYKVGIFSEFLLTINLVGTNEISIAPGKDSCGIENAKSDLIITDVDGSGSLAIGSNTPETPLQHGIWVLGNLTISGGDITSTGKKGISLWSDAGRKLTISGVNTSVTATGITEN
ncbi:MAG: hypothetical protein RSC31_06320, partial [Anaerovoracaceae bacterium]